MTALDDIDEVVEQYALAAAEFIKGNSEPYKMVFSHQEDVTFANPYGPPVRGWEQVAQTMERAASYIRDGKIAGFENLAKYVTPKLAYVVAIERGNAKFGGSEDIAPFALRATMILRPEEGPWKVVHLHADSITTPQPAKCDL